MKWRSGNKELLRPRGILPQSRDSFANQDPPGPSIPWRAADFAVPDARLGLILSGRRFLVTTRSVAAKRELLLEFAPLVMVNLGELRLEKVFPTASTRQ